MVGMTTSFNQDRGHLLQCGTPGSTIMVGQIHFPRTKTEHKIVTQKSEKKVSTSRNREGEWEREKKKVQLRERWILPKGGRRPENAWTGRGGGWVSLGTEKKGLGKSREEQSEDRMGEKLKHPWRKKY